MTNFVIGKLGLSCRFDWPSHDSNWFSAADDISRLIVNISYNNPNDNFYIIGNNDLDTLKYQRKQELFPHNNVFNTYNNKKKLGEKYHHSGWKTPLEYLNKNSINIDYGIIAFGSVLPRNVPNKTYTKSGTIAKPLDRAVKYVAPYVNVLNELGIDWVSLVDDPRHFSVKMLDLFNKPKVFLSQVKGTEKFLNIISYENQEIVETDIPVKYSYVETNVVLDEKISFIDESWKNRRDTISIVLNQAGTDETLNNTSKLGNGHRPRYPILKDWILDNYDANVYGKWSDEILKSNKSFRGTINRGKLYPEMSNWKHSLCVPIDKGWATAKYLEYLKCGISPFMHPEYDDQRNTNVQDFYRVQSVEEMKDKIAMNDNTHIEEINKGINSCLSDEYISGQKINDEIYYSLGLKRDIKNKTRDLWTPQAVGSLDEFLH